VLSLVPDAYRDLVRRALEEDIGSGDATSRATIAESQRARGTLLAKSAIVVAGLDVAAEAFHQLDRGAVVEVRWGDGAHVQAGEVVALVTGDARALLAAERTALNYLQRLSGIATLTARCVQAAGGRITVLDTRKTTPTLRALEKYAVRAGRGTNHRAGLDDGVLIKDNHVRLAGGVEEAVKRMKNADPEMPIEVEAQSLEQVDAAIAAGADIILVDNLPIDVIREAVKRVKGRAKIELSGGVTLDRIPELATTGANYVSVGALTHSAPAADLSFELEPEP
jgi:nicotinate-nucleotide pyrophosphorylase (carboxylating)